ncbi:MAG: nitronate monooxygenase [Sphingomonadales bacterium]|jgi:nitronate monooxygenase|nr:nitronate monooxygenase [Sphingomonadales bacterium]
MVAARWPDRRFLERVGTEFPIVQAPMAGAGDVALCIGAIEGGALGSLACGMLSPEQVREQADAVRARTGGALNLNFFCHEMPEEPDDRAWRALLRPYYDEYGAASGAPARLRLPFDAAACAAVEAVRPDVVSFHFGLPEAPLLRRVKASGAVVLGNATTAEEAKWLERHGADAVIAQGREAGGHTGRFLATDAEPLGLFALLPQIVDAVRLPVIAAGGIGDARGIAAAFALGASAVQLGTAYLHCPEATISVAHRALLRDGAPTVVTNLLTGGLARGFAGRLVRELGPVRREAPPYPLAAVALAPIRAAAEAGGEYGFGPMWAGEAAALGEALPARELTRKLAAEALALLGRLA